MEAVEPGASEAVIEERELDVITSTSRKDSGQKMAKLAFEIV